MHAKKAAEDALTAAKAHTRHFVRRLRTSFRPKVVGTFLTVLAVVALYSGQVSHSALSQVNVPVPSRPLTRVHATGMDSLWGADEPKGFL
jgi:hypothetical protein